MLRLSLLLLTVASSFAFSSVRPQPSREYVLAAAASPRSNHDSSLLSRQEFLRTTTTAATAAALLQQSPASASVAEPSASAIAKGVDREISRKILQIERVNVDSNAKGDPKKHLPQVTVSGDKVTCVIPHVMDPEKPHFIEYVWLKDEDSETIVAAKQFKATDSAPPTLVATGIKKGTTLTPVSYCNLHGLWIGDAEIV